MADNRRIRDPSPPPSGRRSCSGKKLVLPNNKWTRAIFGTQTFGLRTPPLLASNACLTGGYWPTASICVGPLAGGCGSCPISYGLASGDAALSVGVGGCVLGVWLPGSCSSHRPGLLWSLPYLPASSSCSTANRQQSITKMLFSRRRLPSLALLLMIR